MNDLILVKEFEKMISFFKSLKKDELNSIIKKEKEIIFELRDKKDEVKKNIEKLMSDEEIENIILKLNSMKERIDGEECLIDLKLNRQNLEKVLKKLDTPFVKKDSISKLYDKIIESTIGYKLRSQAIQNNINNQE